MYSLTHWGRVMHICVCNLAIIVSDNGLSPGRRQAIIWTNAGILLIGPLGTNFNEISSRIQIFSFKKMHLKRSSAKWRPFCLGLNGLTRSSLAQLMAWWAQNHCLKKWWFSGEASRSNWNEISNKWQNFNSSNSIQNAHVLCNIKLILFSPQYAILPFLPLFTLGTIWMIQCKPDISRSCISRNRIYRGRMLDPIFWPPISLISRTWHTRVRFFAKSR